ncbi:hypothetical protein QFC22_002966 [Naganishia vaughanmartiniae]|uniref:Uncharacterized protein n=1 Tax=Naganishia vaughanmartiniae TaxID=1424756 RepID=A0ACC2X7S3_9TREE|nr:hypothetical protein QFC22_002966 [Naganishia vaughanmartiniae]
MPSSEESYGDSTSPNDRRRATSSNPDASQFPFTNVKNPSPYEVMHLPTTADPKEVKQRYYRLALLYHPDSPHASASPTNFSLLNRAYKLLSSPHSRATYHRTGLGWGSANDVLAGRTTDRSAGMGGFNRAGDEEMRRQARARAYSYSYPSSGGGPSFAGGPGYAGYANGRGGSSYDQTRWGAGPADGMGNPNPNGNYTTNTRFIGSLVIISMFFTMVQYNRALSSSLWTKEMLDAKHVGASQALAEAKHEAALYGRIRRDRIRRAVRAREVEKEYERKVAEAEVRAGAAAGAVGDVYQGGGAMLSESLEPEVRNNEVIRDMLRT